MKKSKMSSKAANGKKPDKQAGKVSFYHVLTAEDAKLLQAALDAPPTPYALKAAKSYRRYVLHAD